MIGAADRVVSGADARGRRGGRRAAGPVQRTLLASLREVAGSADGRPARRRSPGRRRRQGVRPRPRRAGPLRSGSCCARRGSSSRRAARPRCGQLREWWHQLLARATSGWRTLRTFLASMRNRAGPALFNTCGDACALLAAKRQGRQLESTEVPPISFKARQRRRPAAGRPTTSSRCRPRWRTAASPSRPASRIADGGGVRRRPDEHPGPHRRHGGRDGDRA